MIASTRYSFFLKSPSEGTLVDEATGRRARVARPGCSYSGGPADGSPWLVFDCRPSSGGGGSAPVPELYSIATGVWRAVTPSPSIANPCAQDPYPDACDELAYPVAAGSHWIEYSIASANVHSIGHSEFQNLATGEVRGDPTGGNKIVDLNSPSLSQTLCAPLRVPRYYRPNSGFTPGSVVPDGKFAISLGTDNSGLPLLYLDRCGTHLHRLLTTGSNSNPQWAANRTSVVWLATGNELSGVFLPSLRRFTIRVPARVLTLYCQTADLGCIGDLALTAHHLYLVGGDGRNWISPSPTEPKTPRARP